jgi:SAM-dependent methyltransferase
VSLGASNPPLTLSGWLRWYALQPLLRELAEDSSLLEVGCGIGGFAARLDRRFNYVGYEMDPQSASVAAARVQRGEVICEALPPEPIGLFDALAAFEVIEHLEDDAGALRAWRRWIRPGGRILLSVPADPGRFGPSDVHVGHHRRYTPTSLKEVLTATGYLNVRIYRYGAPLNYLTDWVRHRLVRQPAGSYGERTAASGRLFQPPSKLGWATWLVTLPVRYLQQPLSRRGYGLALIATGLSG